MYNKCSLLFIIHFLMFWSSFLVSSTFCESIFKLQYTFSILMELVIFCYECILHSSMTFDSLCETCHYSWYAYAPLVFQLGGNIYPSHTIKMPSSISWLVSFFSLSCLPDLYLNWIEFYFDRLISVFYLLVWY